MGKSTHTPTTQQRGLLSTHARETDTTFLPSALFIIRHTRTKQKLVKKIDFEKNAKVGQQIYSLFLCTPVPFVTQFCAI